MPQMNYPNMGNNQQMQNIQQYPYGNNNYSMNQPYDYMGRQMQQNLPIQYLKCRPVASKEEARACQIDLDGLSTYGDEIIYITNKIFSKLNGISTDI